MIKLSINCVAAVMALIQVSTVVLITIETKKAIGFDILLMVKNLSKTIIAMLIMIVVVFAVGRIEMTNFLKLILEILAGGVAYLAASVVLRASAFSEIIGLIKSVRERGQ